MEDGTYTILALDVPEAARQLEIDPKATRLAIARCNDFSCDVIARFGGEVLQNLNIESSLIALFRSAKGAVNACCQIFVCGRNEDWHPGREFLRAAIATGDLTYIEEAFDGPALVTVHALREILNVGQVGIAESTRAVVRDTIDPPTTLISLGTHHLEDSIGAQSLFQLGHPALPSEFKPLVSLLSFPSNLPREATPFVGRSLEIELIKEKFYSAPAVVLTGMGGIGKTRVAIEVARSMMEQHFHSACYVDLSRIAGRTAVLSALAKALDVAEGENDLLDRITDHLSGKEMLVVIDNCENVVDEVSEIVAAILRFCYHVQLLLTSRKPLPIARCAVYRMRPMALPKMQDAYDLQELRQIDSVRLFINRASLNAEFAFEDNTAPLVVEIISQLEGIPLAIEIAAARVRYSGLERVRDALRDRFESLDEKEDASDRTVREALQWSYGLLTESTQELFKRLCIFHGNFTIEAVQGICGTPPLDCEGVGEQLRELSELSLIEFADEHRYGRLLETTREFGLEKLIAEGAVDALGNRHAAWFLEDMESQIERQYSSEEGAMFDYMEAIYPNLLAALNWSIGGDDPLPAFRMVVCLYMFWYTRVLSQEGVDWIQRVLKISRQLGDVERSRLLNMLGTLATVHRQLELAISSHKKALQIGKKLSDDNVLMATYTCLGTAYRVMGECEKSYQAYSEVLVRANKSSRPGDLMSALINVGVALTDLGRIEEAELHLNRAMSNPDSMESSYGRMIIHSALATCALHRSDSSRFESDMREAIKFGRQIHAPRAISTILRYCAYHAVQQELYNKAAALFGFEKKLREECGGSVYLHLLSEYQSYTSKARAELKERYAKELAAGAQLTLEEALALAAGDFIMK